MESLKNNDVNFIERFLHAFKILGGNELGVIDYEHFKRILLKNHSAEAKDIINLIHSENHVHENKLDFVNLCCSVLSSKTAFNNTIENGKTAASVHPIDTRTFTRNKGPAPIINGQNDKIDSVAAPKVECHKQMKGLLFNVNGDLLSYRYQLDVQENSSLEITAQALSAENTSRIPIEIFIFQDGRSKVFITSSSFVNSNGCCSVRCSLKKGKYILVPILLKWNTMGKSNSFDSLNLESLLHVEEGDGITLTPACESALKAVFNAIDLDGNGLLSQPEFDFFIRHTSGETAAEEWTTIEDNFKMENRQLTFEGFLELYKMVLQTDPADVMNMLQQMGMNESLELENALPFVLNVTCSSPKLGLRPLPVSSSREVAEKVLRKVAVDKGVSRKVKNMNDLFLFIHRLPHRATLVVQNQSHSKLSVQLDCSRSPNCESHRGSLDVCVEVPPRSSLIGHHLFPIDRNQDWKVECSESLK